ncbi:unnamed protein product [Vitrella brassicaformis CCMP3155]|uniref:Protein transport protein Sec61 subunit beta n=2 Tax=Vitrella brassicaformis TaxID=1169539 RepID=A0A0G4FG29_VITBC|nr:unnamed protein product [Vitrella brassicaformis CCMP3155]|mmetsp:Transcript_9869/g.24012  ORF Transcript_9869/g.24012 Transcript_9869/m.24012 type:complete len:104 (+) Transcript_9869:65-376(+)|eukprot:CEM12157.1 unnamed protein product [Vitrella brassicaformis CCMP3155]
MARGASGSQAATSASSGKGGPATTIGGQRTTLARRNVGRSSAVAPSSKGRGASSQGILRFYTDDAPGLKVGPTTVLVLSLVFMAIVVILHIMGKTRAGRYESA